MQHQPVTKQDLARALKVLINERVTVRGLALRTQMSPETVYAALHGRASDDIVRRLTPAVRQALDGLREAMAYLNVN